MTRRRSNEVLEVPLHLLPQALARQIRKAGDIIYRISVKRTHWHHYNISVRTRLFRKELAPGEVAVIGAEITPGTGKRERRNRAEGTVCI